MFLVQTRARDYFFNDPWFKENWFNYDHMKESICRVGNSTWEHLKEYMDDLATLEPLGSAYNCYRDLVEEETEVVPFPQRWMLPSIRDKERTDLEIFKDPADIDLIRLHEDEQGNMEISLDTHLYNPERIKVYVQDDHLVVCGRQEGWSGDGRQMVIHSFKRTYKLPKGVQKKNVKSDLSKDGVLVVNVKVAETDKEVVFEVREKMEEEEHSDEEKHIDPIKDGWIVHPAPDTASKSYLSDDDIALRY